MKRFAVLTAAVIALAGCASEPPPVSTKVQDAYEKGATLPPPTAKPLAVFIGDSYTQGAGATTDDKTWVAQVATAMGWGYDNLGRGSTGYLSTAGADGCGYDVCHNYQQMSEAAIAAEPSVVVVAGGQNDFSAFGKDPAKVTTAIKATYTKLRKSLPKTRIIAVGPSTPWEITPEVGDMDSVVREAAASVKAEYISLLDPNVISPAHVLRDKTHVNDAGHAAIAKRVISALR